MISLQDQLKSILSVCSFTISYKWKYFIKTSDEKISKLIFFQTAETPKIYPFAGTLDSAKFVTEMKTEIRSICGLNKRQKFCPPGGSKKYDRSELSFCETKI